MEDLIYIVIDKQRQGPYTSAQIHKMLGSGAIAPTTPAWREGMADWVPLHTVLPAAEQNARPASSVPAPSGPRGVGGWLLFFCIVLTIIGPLISVFRMVPHLMHLRAISEEVPGTAAPIICEDVGMGVLLIVGFIVGVRIWRGNPRGRQIARRFLLFRLAGFIGIECVVVLVMRGNLPNEMAVGLTQAIIGAMLRECVFFQVWWWYFSKSKRVRNTYGEP